MTLDIIREDIEKYKEFINSTRKFDEVYKWEALQTFQENWNIEATDFRLMFDNSFKNKLNNLWANPHWFPKSVMLTFIELDKERVRTMFRELFDEDKLIDKRIDHFVWHCDELLKIVAAEQPTFKSHFHDGQRMITLYLAFRFPEKYAIYKFTEFKTFMEHVRAKNIPGTGEYERFFKVVRTLYGIITQDKELVDMQKSLLTSSCFEGETLMLAQDFIFVTARRFMN
ncbi:MAG TPA: hypothetical protein VNI52_02560 [Sphingobacteriaceae bacterium]|nr:hypothetical protein [Sphingobacteriaceae bacterium]